MADSFKLRFPSTPFDLDDVQLCVSKFSARIEPWFRLTTLKSDRVIQTIAIEIVKLVMNYPEVIRQSVAMAQDGRSLALNALRFCDPPTAGRRPVERPLPLLLKMFKLAADDHKRSKQIFHILMLMREDLKKVTENIAARKDLPSSFDWPGRPPDDAFYKERTGGDDKALSPGRISFAKFKFQLDQTHEALEELVMKFGRCVLAWWCMVEKNLLIIQEVESHININADHSNYPFDMNTLRHEWKDVKSQWDSFLRTLHEIEKHKLTVPPNLSLPSRTPEHPLPPAEDYMSVATNGPGNSLVNESSDMPNRTTSQDQRGRVPEPSTLSPPKSESIRPAAYRPSATANGLPTAPVYKFSSVGNKDDDASSMSTLYQPESPPYANNYLPTPSVSKDNVAISSTPTRSSIPTRASSKSESIYHSLPPVEDHSSIENIGSTHFPINEDFGVAVSQKPTAAGRLGINVPHHDNPRSDPFSRPGGRGQEKISEQVAQVSTLAPPTYQQAAYHSPATPTAVYQHYSPPRKPEILLSPARDRKLVATDSPTHSPVNGGGRMRHQPISPTRKERVAQPPTPAPPTSKQAQQPAYGLSPARDRKLVATDSPTHSPVNDGGRMRHQPISPTRKERVAQPQTPAPRPSKQAQQPAYCSPATPTAAYQPYSPSQPPHKPEIPLSPARDRKLVATDSPTHSPVNDGGRMRHQPISPTRKERVAQPPTPATSTSKPAQQVAFGSPATPTAVYQHYSNRSLPSLPDDGGSLRSPNHLCCCRCIIM